MSFLPLDRLREGALELGVELSGDQLDLLDQFAMKLVETNKQFNLTRIVEPEDILTFHYLDSFTCLAATDIPKGARVIDVGTGAGLPGIPIAIARPDLHLTLLDATFKKVKFIGDTVKQLKLENADTMHGRAEEIAHDDPFREQFDVATARALSEVKVLAELCIPFVKVGGKVIAQKSTDIAQEVADARAMIGQLGGKIERTAQVTIPGTDIVRQVLVISKHKPTPKSHPRPYAKIVQKRKK